jgi:hypothetical protein
MGLGGGKGRSRGSQSDPAAATLAKLGEQFTEETAGIRTGLIDQMQEILTTGGTNLPIISQAVEGTRRASSKALRGTEEELARTGLSGTPFGERIEAEQRTTGDIAAATTKTDIVKQLFSMIPNFVLGQSQTALSGLSGAVGGNVSARGSSKGARGSLSGK